MLNTIINPFIMLFALFTTTGVLVHDTQIDRAAMFAITVPAAIIGYAGLDTAIKSGDAHTHVERVSGPKHLNTLRATLPRIQPRDDDRRYLQNKKIYFGGADGTSIWPSV